MTDLSLDAIERERLCDLMEELGPEAPTLLDPWTTRDLAAHLVLREHDNRAAPGLVVPGAWGRFAERRRQALTRSGYATLLTTIRSGPPPRVLSHRVGAPWSEPQRVLRSPRGCPQSQRSRSPDERRRTGRSALAQCRRRGVVPHTAAPRRRARAGVGGDDPGPARTARRAGGPPRRTTGRVVALPLRASGLGPGRSQRPSRGARGRRTSAVRHVTTGVAARVR